MIYIDKNTINATEAEGKAKAAADCARILAKEKNPIVRDEYIKSIISKLEISAESFLQELKRASYLGGTFRQKIGLSFKRPDSKVLKAQKTLIRIWMDDPSLRPRISSEAKEDEFSDPAAREIFSVMTNLGNLEEEQPYGMLVDMLKSEDAKKALSQIALDKYGIVDIENTFKDCIAVIKSNFIRLKIDALRALMEKAEKDKDVEKLNGLQEEYLRYHGQILSI